MTSKKLGFWLALSSLALAATAQAAGFWLPGRGVRPMGRGGAFVAGVDDLQAVFYNPAGLASLTGEDPSRSTDAGGDARVHWSVLIDFALISNSASFTRIDSGGNVLPTVHNGAAPLPIPTLAVGHSFSKKLVGALSLWAPYASLASFPETIEVNGQQVAAPQRYSTINSDGTIIAVLGAAVAYKVSPLLRLGFGLQNLFASYSSRTVISSCPSETLCAPEDPEFDATGQVDQTGFFNPSANAGAQLVTPKVRVGLAVQLGYSVHATGKMRVRLPSSAFFDGAHISGDQGKTDFKLPAIIRGGVEVRPTKKLRLEAAFDYELWSEHKNITITPDGIRIDDVAAVGSYDLSPQVIQRNFQNTLAVHLGGEDFLGKDNQYALRAGYVFEQGAPPEKWLSPLTIDTAKDMFTAGAGWRSHSHRLHLDAMVAYVAQPNQKVRDSEVRLLNGIRVPQPTDPPLPVIGNGDYTSSYLLFGLGLRYDR